MPGWTMPPSSRAGRPCVRCYRGSSQARRGRGRVNGFDPLQQAEEVVGKVHSEGDPARKLQGSLSSVAASVRRPSRGDRVALSLQPLIPMGALMSKTLFFVAAIAALMSGIYKASAF